MGRGKRKSSRKNAKENFSSNVEQAGYISHKAIEVVSLRNMLRGGFNEKNTDEGTGDGLNEFFERSVNHLSCRKREKRFLLREAIESTKNTIPGRYETYLFLTARDQQVFDKEFLGRRCLNSVTCAGFFTITPLGIPSIPNGIYVPHIARVSEEGDQQNYLDESLVLIHIENMAVDMANQLAGNTVEKPGETIIVIDCCSADRQYYLKKGYEPFGDGRAESDSLFKVVKP